MKPRIVTTAPERSPDKPGPGPVPPQVLRSIENPNDVIVTHAFDSPEAAREFFAMPELKEAMSKAGVDADSVEISHFDEVEAGTLVGV